MTPRASRHRWPTQLGGLVCTFAIFNLLLLSTGCSPANDESRKAAASGAKSQNPASNAKVSGNVTCWNDRIANVPWSIHIVRIDRKDSNLAFASTHAKNHVIGLGTLSSQLKYISPEIGKPVAAVNGDFYVVNGGPYLGDPRGVQIMNGELTSSPTDQVTFWIDPNQQPRIGHIESKLSVTWPDGSRSAFAVNEERGDNECVLYTPRLGRNTNAGGGREAILEWITPEKTTRLEYAKTYTAKIIEFNEDGDTKLQPGRFVLSLGNKMAKRAKIAVGDTVRIETATEPSLAGVTTAVSGGNIMLQNGELVDFQPPPGSGNAYKFRSVIERHPRTAIGFNKDYIFLVLVDGRQPELSVGMTLKELGSYMRGLGCTEAMNFDGGGSSTMWFDGRIVNSPCNGGERDIANGLVVVRKP